MNESNHEASRGLGEGRSSSITIPFVKSLARDCLGLLLLGL